MIKEFSTVPTSPGDPLFSKWGPDGDPIFSEMGTLASRMGTQKAHVFKIDGNKLICRNKGRKKMIFRVWRHLMHTDCYIFIK